MSLEALLQEKEAKIVRDEKLRAKASAEEKKNMLTADKSATLYDFIKMVDKIVTATMQDLKVEFVPDEGKKILLSPDKKIDHPYITYKIISRVPDGELKPRHRETVIEKIHDKEDARLTDIYGQKFKCIIQFNVLASVYDTAEMVMERFEELILRYTGYFKKNGVQELLFRQQLTDESYDTYRETISVRNLQYNVAIEKLTAIFVEEINEIETTSLQ